MIYISGQMIHFTNLNKKNELANDMIRHLSMKKKLNKFMHNKYNWYIMYKFVIICMYKEEIRYIYSNDIYIK